MVLSVAQANFKTAFNNRSIVQGEISNLPQTYINELDTNVAGDSCAYDRTIITNSMNAYFTGDAGVFRFDEIYELDCESKKISDHYPVYGMFRIN